MRVILTGCILFVVACDYLVTESSVAGSYEVIQINGSPITDLSEIGVTLQLRSDGSVSTTTTTVIAGKPVTSMQRTHFEVVGFSDDCFALEFWDVDPQERRSGSTVCGEVLTLVGSGSVMVAEKRQ